MCRSTIMRQLLAGRLDNASAEPLIPAAGVVSRSVIIRVSAIASVLWPLVHAAEALEFWITEVGQKS